jgi:hypothetical protein
MEDERTLYPSYAGLNRVAMIGGVPMFPALIIGCTSLIASMIGGFVLGPGGLLIGSAGVPIFMFFRTLPAAFILYWLATNVIYCAMQMYMTKRMQQEQAGGGTGKPGEKPARRGLIETIMPGLGARARKANPKPGASSGGADADESRKSLAEKEQAERKLQARGRPRRKGPRK